MWLHGQLPAAFFNANPLTVIQVKHNCIIALVNNKEKGMGKFEKHFIKKNTFLELQSMLGCVQSMQHLQQTPNVLSFQHTP